MDLSKLSDADLQALQGGDMTKVSDAGLAELHNQLNPAPPGPFDGENPLQALGHVGRGVFQDLAAGAGNIGVGALNAGHDLYHRLTTGDSNSQPLVKPFSGGQAGNDVLHELAGIPGVQPTIDMGLAGAHAIAQAATPANFVGDLVRNTAQVGGDVAQLAPLAGVAKGVSAVTDAAEGAGTAWHGIGLRTGAGHPIARAIEDDPAALKVHNEQIGNQVSASEAGADISQPLDYNALSTAREGPNSVYNRLANGFGDGDAVDLTSDKGTVDAINSAGSNNNALVAKSEAAQQQIAAQKQLLLQGPMSGDTLINTMRALRQQGFKNAASQVVADQELGSAQLDMSHALEDHVGNNLPAGGDVSLEQFQDARTALAKNYAVEGALHGNDVDATALAQIQRNNPNQLTGGLQTLASFANGEGRDVVGLAPKFGAPSYPNDLASAINLHRPITHFVGGFGGRALARRILTGGTENGLQDAAAAFPTRDPSTFAPQDPMTGPLYDDDLRRFTTTPGGVGGAATPAGSGIPLSELLSHGVEQGAPQGLSLAQDGTHAGSGLPFSAPPESVGAQFVQGGSPRLSQLVDDYGNHVDASLSNNPGAQWEAQQAPGRLSLGDRVAGPGQGGFDPRQTGAVGAEGRIEMTPVGHNVVTTPDGQHIVADGMNRPVIGPGVPGSDMMAAGPLSGPSQPWLAGGPGRSEGDTEALMRLLDDLQGVDPTLPKKRPR